MANFADPVELSLCELPLLLALSSVPCRIFISIVVLAAEE
jgi:hypothetical protein